MDAGDYLFELSACSFLIFNIGRDRGRIDVMKANVIYRSFQASIGKVAGFRFSIKWIAVALCNIAITKLVLKH